MDKKKCIPIAQDKMQQVEISKVNLQEVNCLIQCFKIMLSLSCHNDRVV